MSLNVPIIDVHRENFKDFWPAINLAIQTASYIAIDTELSGLGNRRKLMAKSIEDRYKSIAEVAKTRSILSLGLSCFKIQEEEDHHTGPAGETPGPGPTSQKFLAQTFNILTLCNEDYMVEPGALQFLVGHGFDFNKQYSCGVPYCRGPDRKEDKSWPTLRLLFNNILASKKPLTLHNGLVDLVFLYQNFYTDLPPSSAQFIADLYEMYSGGIIDTKYVAEYEARMPSSYLEYVFRKSQRDNAIRKTKGLHHASVVFCQYSPEMNAVEYQSYLLPPDFEERQNGGTPGNKSTEICEIYAAHGCCGKGIHCPKSHDPNAILDAEEIIVEDKRKRKRRRRNRKNRNQEVDVVDGETDKKKMKEREGEGEEKQKEGNMNGGGAAPEGNEAVSEESVPVVDGDKPSDFTEANDTEGATESGPLPNGADGPKRTEPKGIVPKKSGSHRAGFDAFMTGFATAAFIARFGSTDTPEGAIQLQNSTTRQKQGGQLTSRVGQLDQAESCMERHGIGHLTNKLYLSGKDYPLAVAKSSFTKTSTLHKDKMDMIIKLMAS
ncbi:target of EGR1 protein 1 [Strongylocentrotus purpuratus]|uniref:Target of EGR1 protein 1 n=1 Tax=Strongylocentrotus purpuratus TaxID=7668 RepID=A0A7M7RD79_STRPU|nr:target of EGR1 protein 1 [Strongylocentrotus purpuratus]